MFFAVVAQPIMTEYNRQRILLPNNVICLDIFAGYTFNAGNAKKTVDSGAPAKHGSWNKEGQVDQRQLFSASHYFVAHHLVGHSDKAAKELFFCKPALKGSTANAREKRVCNKPTGIYRFTIQQQSTSLKLWFARTTETESALRRLSRGNKMALKTLKRQQARQLLHLTELVRRAGSEKERMKLNAIVIIEVHNRDIHVGFWVESL